VKHPTALFPKSFPLLGAIVTQNSLAREGSEFNIRLDGAFPALAAFMHVSPVFQLLTAPPGSLSRRCDVDPKPQTLKP
jgi:hypothetical protein